MRFIIFCTATIMLTLAVVLILASINNLVLGVYFKTYWSRYVQLIIAHHENNTIGPYIINPCQFSRVWLQSCSSANFQSMACVTSPPQSQVRSMCV